MEPIEIIQELFDKKTIRIIQLFMKDETKEYYLREISKITKVSPASTYRILKKLVRLGILNIREIKTAKLYLLSSGKTIDFLKTLLEIDPVQIFIENASKFEGIEEILLLGQKEKTKANLLILGHLNSNELKRLCAEIKEKYNYTINQMLLTKEQYEQMSAMGLYPGTKKSLFKKSLT